MTRSKNISHVFLKAALIVGSLAAISALIIPAAPGAEVIAIDSKGDAYIVGSGDDCGAAWVGAWTHVPEDWTEVYCDESGL